MQKVHAIILVDDDPINNLINKRLIGKLQVCDQVEEFLEAEKALKRIESISIEDRILVLLDINMPVMNGWDFLNRYMEAFPTRRDKIVMLSSSIDFQDRQKALRYAIVEGFIEKPLTPDKIKTVL